jgi:hypothetical protein
VHLDPGLARRRHCLGYLLLLKPNKQNSLLQRRVIVPSSIDLPSAPKKTTSTKNCPKDASWEEATEARLNLLDHLVRERNNTSQEKGDLVDQEKWLEQRIRHNVKGILRDISPSVPLREQLYCQGRKWFQDNKVGQFLDNLHNLARKPEFQRTSENVFTRICISNTSVLSKHILLSRVKNTGITLVKEDQAEFEVKFSGQSRIQSASWRWMYKWTRNSWTSFKGLPISKVLMVGQRLHRSMTTRSLSTTWNQNPTKKRTEED